MGFRLPVRQVIHIEQRWLHRLYMSDGTGVDGPGRRQGWELLHKPRERGRLRDTNQRIQAPAPCTVSLEAGGADMGRGVNAGMD
jgi:hypothetical protein